MKTSNIKTDLDYSELFSSVSRADIKKFQKEHPTFYIREDENVVVLERDSKLGIAILVLFGIIFIPLTFLFLVSTLGVVGTALNLTGLVFLSPIIALAGVYLFRKYAHDTMKKSVRLTRFAKANNLKYSHLPGREGVDLSGLIFTSGNQGMSDRFILPDGTEVGNYTVQSSSNSRQHSTSDTWTYLKLKLNRQVPHFILDSKANNLTIGGSNLPADLSRDNILNLEGDFNNYFTLYAPKGYETDALYIFTPNLMQLLIESNKSGSQYDMEAVGDSFYIYYHNHLDLASPASWNQLLRVAEELRPTLDRQTRNYTDETIGDRSLNEIAPAGQRATRPSRKVSRNLAVIAGMIVVWVIAYYMLSS